MPTLEYYTSERFIHDDLVKEIEMLLPLILHEWKTKGHIDAFMISWPSEPVLSDIGIPIEGSILCELPKEHGPRKREIYALVERTGPFGLLLCEQTEEEVRLVFETAHGPKSWHFPIEKHGLDYVLGKMTEREDVPLGIIGSPQPTGA